MQIVKKTLAGLFFTLFLLAAGCGTIAQKAAAPTITTQPASQPASQPLGDRWKTSYLRGDSVRSSNVDLSMEEKRNTG